MKILSTSITVLLLFILSAALPAQQGQPLRAMLDESNRQIRSAEAKGDRLLYMQCDILPKGGEDPRFSLFNLRASEEYEFILSTSPEIQALTIFVLDSEDLENPIHTETIHSGRGRFKIKRHSGSVVIALNPESYRSGAIHGFFSLVITHRASGDPIVSRPDNPSQPSGDPSGPNITPIGGGTETSYSDDCGFDVIEGMKFQTSRQSIEEEDGRVRRKELKSKVQIDDNLRNIEQDVKGEGATVYRITKKGCDPGGVFRLQAESNMGIRFTLFVNLNTREFTVVPEGGNQRIHYNMEKIKD